MDEESEKKLRKIVAKMEQKLDQRLADVRGEYVDLDASERVEFRQWLQRILDASFDAFFPLQAVARVSVYVRQNTEDVESIDCSVPSLLRATEAWDRGEHYTPGGLRDS